MSALEEVRDLAEAVAKRRSLRVWDVELGGMPNRTVVRVFVDADDGVDIDTVAEVSEEISRGLDLRDPIPGRYTLEVSSPGLERNLKSPEHFAASVGKHVVVKTKEVLVGASHRLEGTVAGVGPTSFSIATGAQDVDVPYSSVKTARTVFEWGSGG